MWGTVGTPRTLSIIQLHHKYASLDQDILRLRDSVPPTHVNYCVRTYNAIREQLPMQTIIIVLVSLLLRARLDCLN